MELKEKKNGELDFSLKCASSKLNSSVQEKKIPLSNLRRKPETIKR